jgi:hypothetical protein
MKLLSLFLLIFCIAIFRNTFSQKIITTLDGPEKIEPDTLSHWIKKIKSDFSLKLYLLIGMPVELAPSRIIKRKFNRIYSKTITTGQMNWLCVMAWINKILNWKTEDVLQFNSALGYRKTHSNWYHTAKNSITNSQMDMLTQIQKFPYLNALPPYIFLGLERICHKDKQNYFTYPFYIQNNNGTGPETSQPRCFWC